MLFFEVLLVTAFRQPHQRFFRFAFFDSGAEFVRLHLWHQGDRPSIDFGYQYGLTLLLIQDLWYRIFGMTPGAFQSLVLTSNLFAAWGLWRFAMACRLGLSGQVLIVASVPEILGTASISTAHNLEPALLIHAMAEQALGRYAHALALATACVCIKPTMAYVYGALLLSWLIVSMRAQPGVIVRACLPAAALGLTLVAVNLQVFGWEPVRNTLFPMEAADVYRISGYGFFHGSGRQFWALPGARLIDYFRYEVGYWLLGTLLLVVGALGSLARLAWSWWRDSSSPRLYDELIICCALMHVLFVTLFFGNRGSWVYYLVILVLGLAVLTKLGRTHAVIGAGLAILMLGSDYSKARQTAREWTSLVRSDELQDLWTRPEVREEWRSVRAMTRGVDPVLIAEYEGAAVILPNFTRPRCYFEPGRTLAFNIRRKRRQLSEARWIVATLDYDWLGKRLWRPAMADALDGCEAVWQGSHFAVYRRVRPPRAQISPRTWMPGRDRPGLKPGSD
ncbi:MAG: hypothetical protein AB7I30_00840 [Isosphaeraceae bacterium]